jgi:pentatricopeptide repeat protein
MSFRTTLAIETRLSTSRPLIFRRSSRNRPCLLSQFPGSRGLLTDVRPRLLQIRCFSTAAGPLNTQEGARKDGDPPPLPEETDLKGPDLDLDAIGFSHWKFAFKDIFHGNEEERKRAEGNTVLRTEQRATALKFASRRSPEEIHKQWNSMSDTAKRNLLPDILVGCLLVGASLTLRVLEGLPPVANDFTIRMDCLLKLRREPKLWLEIQEDTKHNLMERFLEELKNQRLTDHLPRSELNPGHAELILGHCTNKSGSEFFERYLATYVDRHFELLVIFIDYFTKWENQEQALRAMQLIAPSELEASDQLPSFMQRCTNLLKFDTIDIQEESKNFKILPQLLELGMKPDTTIHNMIIMNAIRCNVHQVGWDLYEYLEAENLETDSVTHLILMKDAFARQDVSSLNKILSAIHKREDLYHSSYLVGCTMNIIRIIHTYEKLSHPIETFSHVLNVHNRAWKPDVYIKLQMIRRSEITVLPDTDLPSPPPDALAWTILQYCLIQQQNQGLVDRLWDILQRAISAGEPQIVSAAAHEALYGGFIVFYGRSPRNLGRAVDIVQHMLNNEHCQPTALTWMRLMGGYLRQGQQQEAEQIRQLMLRRGISPKTKELAWLQADWPGTEVAARARRAFRGENTLSTEDLLDEELYEGVPVPGEGAGPPGDTDTGNWEDMVDPWNQSWSAETPEDAETIEQLQAAMKDVQAR